MDNGARLRSLTRARVVQAAHAISKHVYAMKDMLYADTTNEQHLGAGRQLAIEILRTDIIIELIRNLEKLEFEVCFGLVRRCSVEAC